MKANVNISLHNELLQNTPYLAELLTADNKQPFSVPTDYFNQLQQNVAVAVGITAPAQLTNEVAQIAAQQSFATPTGYFNQLQQNLLNEADLDADTKTIDAIVKPLQQDQQQQTQPFATPANYFNGEFATQLLAQLNALEQPQTPLLNHAAQKSPFSTPANYFEQLETQILQQTAGIGQQQKSESPNKVGKAGKIVPIRQIWQSRVIRYGLSAAAMLAMFVFGIQFFNNNDNNNSTQSNTEQIADISNADFSPNIPPELVMQMATLSKDAIDTYLEEFGETDWETEDILMRKTNPDKLKSKIIPTDINPDAIKQVLKEENIEAILDEI
ncbi:MAG: hypothetical protein IPI59_01430 [Sphingobacteriales bacterium]|jgi:hypothetical protein|nr:hypothetical protein [Sphingobacteriales bacterium]MBP9141331.1 hypothetical protein [Chitinophagales bacterium]MDA0198053.1 hypothetical protein [Bacteroidota bacterium]MBK6890717.1 hypothetical protein [Sphingobacteriales bacterium]MBK7526231.1 hypothetical protein [Sphingobacteriales bacterium]